MDSLSRGQRTFYLFFGAILFVHVALMATKIRDQFSQTTYTPTVKSIKVKLIQEALKEMAVSQRTQIVQSEDSNANKKKERCVS